METNQQEALSRAGLTAIRLAREGDQQAAETLRAQQDRIAELESQLEAIGAGGVEPLRKRECLHQIDEQAPSEWDVRGHLAASLTCWHRLTGQEAAELVALFQGRPAQSEVQRDAERYRWLRNEETDWYVGPSYSTYNDNVCDGEYRNFFGVELDKAIDAARAAQGGV